MLKTATKEDNKLSPSFSEMKWTPSATPFLCAAKTNWHWEISYC